MKEMKKANNRRKKDSSFRWADVFKGRVLDVGSGDDPFEWTACEVTPFDKIHGDASRIDEYFPHGSFDVVISSQFLEHIPKPQDVINRMLNLLKPGGWLVASTPCFDHYEHGILPSRYNGEHKSSWSLWRKNAPTKFLHVYVPQLRFTPGITDFYCWLRNTNYDYCRTDDQTYKYEEGIEAFIEFTMRKAP